MHARAERREADGPVPRVDDAIEIHQVAEHLRCYTPTHTQIALHCIMVGLSFNMTGPVSAASPGKIARGKDCLLKTDTPETPQITYSSTG